MSTTGRPVCPSGRKTSSLCRWPALGTYGTSRVDWCLNVGQKSRQAVLASVVALVPREFFSMLATNVALLALAPLADQGPPDFLWVLYVLAVPLGILLGCELLGMRYIPHSCVGVVEK